MLISTVGVAWGGVVLVAVAVLVGMPGVFVAVLVGGTGVFVLVGPPGVLVAVLDSGTAVLVVVLVGGTAVLVGPPGVAVPPWQGFKGELLLRGVGAAAVKSAALLFVSVQPPPLRMSLVVLEGAGAAPKPSKQVALAP